MNVSNERLNKIYDKTSGKCHLCHKKLAFTNYGLAGAKGAWEIEHSKPKSLGGTNHLNNLFPACISCNRQKSNGTNYSVQKKHSVRNAPLSVSARRKAEAANVAKGVLVGAAIGRMLGPAGVIAGGIIGGVLGYDSDVDR